MRNNLLTQILTLVVVLMMLAAIAIRKDGRIWGNAIGRDTITASVDESAPTDTDTIVINTTELGKDVIGYAGPTPLEIRVADGRIVDIVVLPNRETPRFYAYVERELIRQYIGKTTEQIRTEKIDALSGATFTSKAVMANIERGIATIDHTTQHKAIDWDWAMIAALVVSLMAAILPIFVHHKVYRIVQLCLNVVVLGFYAGTMISTAGMVSVLNNGVHWSNAVIAVLMVIALIYPLFGRRGHYCAWCCPLGSAQELMGKITPRKYHPSDTMHHVLTWMQKILWAVLMLLAWTGIWLDWLDYELFSAFAFESASWGMIAFAAVTLVASIVTPRPYCRYICPTGVMLKSL